MTTFTTQTYNMLLQSLLFSITPALPVGTPGTRPPVGDPETIPDVTFITRALTAADGFPTVERNRMNGYITGAIVFHNLYGLTPVMIDSIEDILNHLQAVTIPIGRIRIVSHGDDAFLFVPMFDNGSWSLGITQDRLNAFQSSDEAGTRFLVSGTSDMIVDGLSTIVDGIRAINSTVLTPFGIQASGAPAPGDMTLFFQVVNDHFQVTNGTLVEQSDHPHPTPPTFALINATQRAALTTALDHLEVIIRGRLVGTTVGTTTLTTAHLDALKAAVTSATPRQLGFVGSDENLAATVLADLAIAMGAALRVEADLRNAIIGHTGEPMFSNNLWGIIEGLKFFNNAVLTLGATTVTSVADISTVPNLENYFFICSDLFFLEHGSVSINGTTITPAQQTTLRDGLRAIAAIIAARITSGPSGITAGQLTALRTAIEGISIRQSAITGGWMTYFAPQFPDMQAAVTALNAGFRTKLNHLRSIMRSSSHVDIRGCLVGATRSYLTKLRTFLGTGANLPTLSAPDWFQSFPAGDQFGGWGTPIFNEIDAIVTGGLGPHITDADVASSFTTWKGLIDFDPHFTFISGLFAGPTSQFDFATLEWRIWRTGTATTGIPILRMEAERIDDIVSLDLGDIIERFRVIFEVPAASAPNTAVRGRLNQLQPHIVAFKTIRTNVAAATGPADPGLPSFFTLLTNLAGQITGIAGFPAPPSPLVPASASLADVQTSVANIQTHIDSLLSTNLDPFFTAVRGQLAHANAEIRYYYNIGLPLLPQSSARPTVFKVSTFMSATTEPQRDGLVANALRSWMRIQWTGKTAQAAAMNATITGLSIANDAQRTGASRVSMLTEGENPTSNAVISPMPDFQTHIITEPP